MNTAVITVAESNTTLAQFSNWLVLPDSSKTFHITRASVYAQTYYTCTDIVWEDDPDTVEVEVVDIPNEVKEAVAYFAYADFNGNLYGDPATANEYKGKLRSKKEQLGDMLEETSWYRGGVSTPNGVAKSLGYPHTLMSLYCTLGADTSLLRV